MYREYHHTKPLGDIWCYPSVKGFSVQSYGGN